ncbi:OmpA family protein [Roseicyclus sp.]|uniref:OmpA family protein n=1 Tax=Roseicyclus sp. TaxID=1914329 RepID=UPI003F6D516F
MIRSPLLLRICAFGLGLTLCIVTAGLLALWMERRSVDAISGALAEGGLTWATVSADGLKVFLDGTAPNEAAAFRASQRSAALVDADRIISRVEIARRDDLRPPRFSLDILRASDGIQVIGLVPAATGVDAINDTVTQLAQGDAVDNLVETADFAVPPTWEAALGYGLNALSRLPRSKVTIYADRVEVQAIAESVVQQAEFMRMLGQNQPDAVAVYLDISAPRPVFTPFQLRFSIGEGEARLESCAADTEAAQRRIQAAAVAAGAAANPVCQIGLGAPSAQWSDAVVTAIAALADLGNGTIAFSDTDVTLIAAEGTSQDDFDRVMGELANALPDLFSLQGVLTQASESGASPEGPARLIATLDAEGQMRLRGRVPEGAVGRSVEAFARALFGAERADIAMREVGDLPAGWSVRAMIGLEALSRLNEGTMTLEPEALLLRGRTGDAAMEAELSRYLGDALGQGAAFELRVSYLEALDPMTALPSPEDCVARIDAIQADTKITFDPGSVEINESAAAILDQIAAVLPDCRHVRMEIAGHTDSQGREEMNLNLSQSRAAAVLNGLLARNVLVSNLVAQGYGESQPIASNETEAGREQNRRITFRLLSEASDESVLENDAPQDPRGPSIGNPQPRPDRSQDGVARAQEQE